MPITSAPARPEMRSWTSPFGWALYHELAGEPGNLFFSPFSLLGALMVARAGAAGATRAAFDKLLGRPESDEPLTESFGRLLRQVGRSARSESGQVELVAANALWCHIGCPVRHHYVETLRAQLNAEVGAVDFHGDPVGAARTINAWVAEVSQGRLSAILGRDQIHSLTRAVLANVIYFKASWLEPFEIQNTRPEPFRLSDGRRVAVAMMHRTGVYPYGRTSHCQVIQLPYVGRSVWMFVLLPDEGRLHEAESELEPGLVGRLVREAQPRESRLSLPSCRIQSSLWLRGALEQLGLVRAFIPGADFSGISEERDLFLDEVVHRTLLEVDEAGTEAAASTAVSATLGDPGLPGRPVEFRVDRPYLLVVADTESETVFFLGRVSDPRG